MYLSRLMLGSIYAEGRSCASQHIATIELISRQHLREQTLNLKLSINTNKNKRIFRFRKNWLAMIQRSNETEQHFPNNRYNKEANFFRFHVLLAVKTSRFPPSLDAKLSN